MSPVDWASSVNRDLADQDEHVSTWSFSGLGDSILAYLPVMFHFESILPIFSSTVETEARYAEVVSRRMVLV